MAGDWIKWQKGLLRKPEVIRIAAMLNLSRHATAGLLMEVWEWADDAVYFDETASGFDPDNCPGFVRLGDSPLAMFDATFAVSGLADAMTAVGWLMIRSGSLAFPNFARHNGKSAKARALDASRKRTTRITTRPVSVPKTSQSCPDATRNREEKRREEKKGSNTKSPPPPLPFASPEFAAAWSDWVAYRRERKRLLTNATIKKQLSDLKEWGEAAAIESIETSIRCGWQGLFPPKAEPQPARKRFETAEERRHRMIAEANLDDDENDNPEEALF